MGNMVHEINICGDIMLVHLAWPIMIYTVEHVTHLAYPVKYDESYPSLEVDRQVLTRVNIH